MSDANRRPPVPPFTEETARQKVQGAEDAWNTCDPDRIVLAYAEDSQWRNRDEFFEGREAIRAFLTRKWARELSYVLRKELWCFTENRISVRFEYESRDSADQWWRSHGNEHWEFDEYGLMRRRDASINDYPIAESDRRIRQHMTPRGKPTPGVASWVGMVGLTRRPDRELDSDRRVVLRHAMQKTFTQPRSVRGLSVGNVVTRACFDPGACSWCPLGARRASSLSRERTRADPRGGLALRTARDSQSAHEQGWRAARGLRGRSAAVGGGKLSRVISDPDESSGVVAANEAC